MTDSFNPNSGIPQAAISYSIPRTVQAPARAPRRLDPSVARKRREQREQGFDFVLHATLDEEGNPSLIRARLPQLFDTETLASLPAEMRREVFLMVEQVEKLDGSQTPGGVGAIEGMSMKELADSFGSMTHVVDAYCITGFVEPRCYATPEEADAKGGVWVRDIEFADRLAFFNHCSAQEKGATAQVKPFPDGRSVSAVGVGSADSALSGADLAERGFAVERSTATFGAS